MPEFYNQLSYEASKLVTKAYSTSFSRSVSFLEKEIRDAIYSIYGFVRLADEIVDTFHDYDKHSLIDRFERNFYEALNEGISLNPVLNSFQLTVKKYNIDDDLIQAFLKSMKLDYSDSVRLTAGFRRAAPARAPGSPPAPRSPEHATAARAGAPAGSPGRRPRAWRRTGSRGGRSAAR